MLPDPRRGCRRSAMSKPIALHTLTFDSRPATKVGLQLRLGAIKVAG